MQNIYHFMLCDAMRLEISWGFTLLNIIPIPLNDVNIEQDILDYFLLVDISYLEFLLGIL